MHGLLLLIGASLLSGCAVARPFRTEAPPAPGSTVVVAVTYARYRPAGATRFWELTNDILDGLPNQQGLLGHSVRRRIFGNEVWTMTVWNSPTTLRTFIRSPAHRAAMAETDVLVAEARFAQFTMPAEKFPPDWEHALAELSQAPAETYGSSPAR